MKVSLSHLFQWEYTDFQKTRHQRSQITSVLVLAFFVAQDQQAPSCLHEMVFAGRKNMVIGGAMYGAILGHIIGSPFEFDRGNKTKDFDLFTGGCQFTDDSVMTAAIAEALMAVGPDATRKEIEDAVISNMQDSGRKYPYAGYGGSFRFGWRSKIQSRMEALEMVLQ